MAVIDGIRRVDVTGPPPEEFSKAEAQTQYGHAQKIASVLRGSVLGLVPGLRSREQARIRHEVAEIAAAAGQGCLHLGQVLHDYSSFRRQMESDSNRAIMYPAVRGQDVAAIAGGVAIVATVTGRQVDAYPNFFSLPDVLLAHPGMTPRQVEEAYYRIAQRSIPNLSV